MNIEQFETSLDKRLIIEEDGVKYYKIHSGDKENFEILSNGYKRVLPPVPYYNFKCKVEDIYLNFISSI
jgi:hypothetical protein